MRSLIDLVLAQKATKINRIPCYVNRASSIGYSVPELGGCLRRGVYERTSWQEKELHDAKTQLIFDEGNNQERAVLADLAEAGVPIIEQQTAFWWEKYRISGHVDGKYVEDGVAYPVEIKSMHPAIFDGISTLEDFKKHPWTRAYLAQIVIYMLCQGIDKGIFILKNKSNGALKQITVDLDYDLGEACLKTCEAINKHVEDKTLPERITDVEVCAKCPFKLICQPEKSWGVPLKIEDDPAFEERITEYLNVKDAEVKCKALWVIIKERCKTTAVDGALNSVVGKYHIIGTTDGRGFSVKIEII
jgi:CRISPR/Cas system-associated exonuclease Cas4 (RecB family)